MTESERDLEREKEREKEREREREREKKKERERGTGSNKILSQERLAEPSRKIWCGSLRSLHGAKQAPYLHGSGLMTTSYVS